MGGHGLTSRTFHLEDKALGVGRFRSDHADRTDELLKLARRDGIRLMLSFDSYNSLQTEARWYGEWHLNPLNSANGGPLKKPADFWTTPEVRRIYRNKLRYIMARWGQDTTVAFWQLWNEADGATGYDQAAAADWHREMAGYLASIDPWRRPITTSFAQHHGTMEKIFALPELHFTTAHRYDAPDTAGALAEAVREHRRLYKKPVLISEFGAGYGNLGEDPDGIHLHNGIWSSLMSGSAGAAQLWYWDRYIPSNHLEKHYGPLAELVARFDFSAAPLRDLAENVRAPAQARALGLMTVDAKRALLWLQNREHTWAGTRQAMEGFTVEINGVADGLWRVTRWDTWDNTRTEQSLRAEKGRLHWGVPRLARDEAYLLEHLGEP